MTFLNDFPEWRDIRRQCRLTPNKLVRRLAHVIAFGALWLGVFAGVCFLLALSPIWWAAEAHRRRVTSA